MGAKAKTLAERLNPSKAPGLVSRAEARRLIYEATLNCIRIKAAAIEAVEKLHERPATNGHKKRIARG